MSVAMVWRELPGGACCAEDAHGRVWHVEPCELGWDLTPNAFAVIVTHQNGRRDQIGGGRPWRAARFRDRDDAIERAQQLAGTP